MKGAKPTMSDNPYTDEELDEGEALIEALADLDDDGDYNEDGETLSSDDIAADVEDALDSAGIEPGDPEVATVLKAVAENVGPGEDPRVDAVGDAMEAVEEALDADGVTPDTVQLDEVLDIVSEDSEEGANDALLGPAPSGGDSEDDDWSNSDEAAIEEAFEEMAEEGFDL